MSSLYLQNPALIWGLFAVAIPIAIHLMTRRRFKVIHWAAMQFLLEANRQNRKRVRLEDLLLLLLRIISIVLLTLLIGRLAISSRDFNLPQNAAQIEHVFILDNSMSMSFAPNPNLMNQDSSDTVFRQGQRHLLNKISDLKVNAPADRVSLYTTSELQPRWSRRTLNTLKKTDIENTINSIQLTAEPADYEALFHDLSLKYRQNDANRIVYVITDLRLTDWTGLQLQAINPDQMEQLKKRVREQNKDQLSGVLQAMTKLADKCADLHLIPIGTPPVLTHPNLAIESIRSIDNTLIQGVSSTFEITIRNVGGKPASQSFVRLLQFNLSVDDATRKDLLTLAPSDISTLTIPALASQESHTATVDLQLTNQQTIQMVGILKDEAGDPFDNIYYFSQEVVAGSPVLIVDGDAGSAPMDSQTVFLERALNPPQFRASDSISGFETQVMAEAAFETANIESYQLIILSNIYRISKRKQSELYKWVQQGGGLMIFLGDAVDPESYNLMAKGKEPIMPAILEHPIGDENQENWMLFNFPDKQHGGTQILRSREINPLVRMVKVFKAWHTSLLDEEASEDQNQTNANKLITLDNPKQSPLLYEKKLGMGYVTLFTTSCDDQWSNWPGNPTYNIMLLELASYLRKKSVNQFKYHPTQILTQKLDLNRHTVELQPSLRQYVFADEVMSGKDLETTLVTEDAEVSLKSSPFKENGLYLLPLKEKMDGNVSYLSYHVNSPVAESYKEIYDTKLLASHISSKKIKITPVSTEIDDELNLNLELWPYLISLLIFTLLLELYLGWYFGKRRSE